MTNSGSRKRVFCVVPPTGKFVREDRCQTPVGRLKTIALRPPIDLMYAAGAFERAGATVKLTDFPAEDLGWREFEEQIKGFQPSDILLSITTVSLERDLEAAAFAKRVAPHAKIYAKGAHFNILDRDVMARSHSLDGVLRGEYEATCEALGQGKPLPSIAGLTWRNESGETIQNAPRAFEMSIDSFALPARHLTNNALYRRPDTNAVQTTIVTNRGCPFHCVYCLANQVAGTKNRYRSVQSVIEEIRSCVDQFGIRNFLFRSELFTQNEKWVVQLCEAIVESGLKIQWACNSRVDTLSERMLHAMKRAGCWIMAFGVESGDQSTLDRLEKRATVEDANEAISLLRRVGIKSSVYLLIGLPWDTESSILNQSRYALELDPDLLEIFYPYPFPGTTLRETAVQRGLIAATEYPEQAYSDPVMPTEHLSIAELRQMRNRLLRAFYVRPRVIARTLFGARSFGEFKNYLQIGASQLRSFVTT